MAEDMRIDSHKLMLHPREVGRWLQGEEIFPLYVEISPSGACNHRCRFCALDYLGYPPRFLDTSLLLARVAEMGRLGVKSVMYGGEGEPLLHKDIGEIFAATEECGIDVALTTNGVLLTGSKAARVVAAARWVKVSLDAGTAATYAALHGTREEDFERVLSNIAEVSSLSAAGGSRCTVGVQAILLPENAREMETLAERVRAAGADYLVVKPHAQHRRSNTRRYAELDYTSWLGLSEPLARFSDERFKVIFRLHSMRKLPLRERGYEGCPSLPFWSYVDSAGEVWGCKAHVGDARFSYGSLARGTCAEVWRGERRGRTLAHAAHDLDPSACHTNCRMDEANRYLWELTHPRRHANFI